MTPWATPSRARNLDFDSHLLRVPIREFDRENKIIYSGNPDAIYYVHRGYVHVTRESAGKLPSHVAIVKPGEVFGDAGLLPPLRAPETATALGEVQVMRYDYPSIVARRKKSDDFAGLLLDLFAARLEDSLSRMRALEDYRIFPRLILSLASLALDIGSPSHLEPGRIDLPLIVTHRLIGQVASCSREVTTGSISFLKRKQCILRGDSPRAIGIFMPSMEREFEKALNAQFEKALNAPRGTQASIGYRRIRRVAA